MPQNILRQRIAAQSRTPFELRICAPNGSAASFTATDNRLLNLYANVNRKPAAVCYPATTTHCTTHSHTGAALTPRLFLPYLCDKFAAKITTTTNFANAIWQWKKWRKQGPPKTAKVTTKTKPKKLRKMLLEIGATTAASTLTTAPVVTATALQLQ